MNSQPEQERRREPRRPARGEVRIWVDAESQPLRCRLLDVSRQGFRVRHRRADLPSGCEVQFQHALASGRARLVWNHILAGNVESGFVIV